MPTAIIKRLQQNILTHLPAWEAHKKMAPPIRRPMPNAPSNVRQSAVCVLLFFRHKKNEPKGEKKLHTLLIKRTQDGKTHGGQISFPGGRLDENDFSLTYCALRECEEEIGLDKNNITILGTLSKLFIPPSNFMVSPVVCFCNEVEKLIRSIDEVEEIIEVAVEDLFHAKSKKEHEVWPRQGVVDKNLSMKAPVYLFDQRIIWGATAMMLAELEEIYLRC